MIDRIGLYQQAGHIRAEQKVDIKAHQQAVN